METAGKRFMGEKIKTRRKAKYHSEFFRTILALPEKVVREYERKYAYSQIDLSRRFEDIGFSQPNLARYEAGQVKNPWRRLPALARVLVGEEEVADIWLAEADRIDALKGKVRAYRGNPGRDLDPDEVEHFTKLLARQQGQVAVPLFFFSSLTFGVPIEAMLTGSFHDRDGVHFADAAGAERACAAIKTGKFDIDCLCGFKSALYKRGDILLIASWNEETAPEGKLVLACVGTANTETRYLTVRRVQRAGKGLVLLPATEPAGDEVPLRVNGDTVRVLAEVLPVGHGRGQGAADLNARQGGC